jgi:hypothetical protein
MTSYQQHQNRKISFRLDESRADALELDACRNGVSVSFIIRHLVIRYLEEQKRLSPAGSFPSLEVKP